MKQVAHRSPRLSRLKAKRAQHVLRCVCQAFDVRQEEALSTSRNRYRAVYPRFFAYVINNILYNITSTESALFYRRDHAGVLHGISVITSCMYMGDHEIKSLFETVAWFFQDHSKEDLERRVHNLYLARRYNSQTNLLTHNYKNIQNGKKQKIH